MNQVDLWSLLGEYNSYGMTGLALYLTVASSYLVAAYLVGNRLTNFQAIVVSGLFFIFAILFTYGTVGFFQRAVFFSTQISGYTHSVIRQRPAVPFIIGALQLIGIVACLKFMWDTRRRRE
jgi:hypothetical protein